MTTNRYIVGLGNYSKNDDGIGLRVIEYIVDNDLDKDFKAVEIGNDGMRLLNYFTPETEQMLIVDCALIGKQPGGYLILDVNDISSKKKLGNISTHEGDILKIIGLAKQLGYTLPPIKIMAIQPESMDMDMTLSDILKKKLPVYVQAALDQIRGKH